MVDFSKYFDAHEAKFPVNVRQLIADEGVELREFETLSDGIAGQIERISENGDFAISTSAKDPVEWRTYIMAHELGHYLLHKSLIGSGVDDSRAFFSTKQGKYFNKNIGDVQELEAHTFACAMLIPQQKVVDFFDNFDGNPDSGDVEAHFGVPAGVVAWWIKGLMSEDDQPA